MTHIAEPCPKCGGRLLAEAEGDIACLQCGYRSYNDTGNPMYDQYIASKIGVSFKKKDGKYSKYDN